MLGSASMGSPSQTYNPPIITELPLNANVVMAPGQRIGFAIIATSGSIQVTPVGGAVPLTVAGQGLNMEVLGYGLNAPSVVQPPYATYFNVNSSSPLTKFIGTVYYDSSQVSGVSAELRSVGVASGMPGLGSNTVRVKVRNNGTGTFANQPITIKYSTDGGTTYPAGQTQSFVLSGLIPMGETEFDLNAAPWAITSVGARTLTAKIEPAIGTASAVSTSYLPDLDIEEVGVNAANAELGANTIRIRVRNNGAFNCNGMSLGLAYAINGTFPVSQTFIPTSLGSNGDSEAFLFSTPWQLSGAASATVFGSIASGLSGDPDTSDVLSRSYPEAGIPGVQLEYSLTQSSAQIRSPFYSTTQPASRKFQCVYSPVDLGGKSGKITQIGFRFETGLANSTYALLRIQLGETTFTTLGTNFLANHNAVQPVTVFQGPFQTPTASNSWKMITLDTPFFYTGVNRLLVTMYTSGITTSAYDHDFWGTSGNNAYHIVYANGQGDASTGTLDSGRAPALRTRVVQSDPGIRVSRGGVSIPVGGTDAVGPGYVILNPHVLQYSIFNEGYAMPLMVTGMAVSNSVGCSASASTPFSGSVTAGVSVPFSVSFQQAAAGPFSFTVTMTTNASQSPLQNFAFTVSGTGVPNSAPQLATPVDITHSPIVLSECMLYFGGARVEICNVSAQDVDTAGWRLIASNGEGSVNSPFPSVHSLSGNIASQGISTKNHTSFTPRLSWLAGEKLWVMLVDPSGAIRDFFAAGWTATEIAALSVSAAGLVGLSPQHHWLGNGVATAGTLIKPETGYARIGYSDHNDQSDWLVMDSSNGIKAVGHVLLWGGASPVVMSGSHPMQSVAAVAGQQLDLYLPIVDANVGQAATVSIEVTGGDLTAAQAGLMHHFPLQTTIPASGLFLRALPMRPGNIVLRMVATDTGSPSQSSVPYFLTVNVSAAVNFCEITTDTGFYLPNGQQDAYRLQTGIPAMLTIRNGTLDSVTVSGMGVVILAPNTTNTENWITISNSTGGTVIPPGQSATVQSLLSVLNNAVQGPSMRIRPVAGIATRTAFPAQSVTVVLSSPNTGFSIRSGAIPVPIAVTTTSLLPATQSIPYGAALESTGGNGAYSWSVSPLTKDPLPSSLTLNVQGTTAAPATIVGTPSLSEAGAHNVTFLCMSGAYARPKTLVLHVQSGPLTIVTASLPNAMEGSAYSATIVAAGGTTSYTWSVAPSSAQLLPPGLTLNPATGGISGVPTAPSQGTYIVTFRLTDDYNSVTRAVTLNVQPGPLNWIGPNAVAGKESVVMGIQLVAAGGASSRVYSVDASSASPLPMGLSLSSSGLLSGAPASGSRGIYPVSVRVVSASEVISSVVTITISLPDPFSIQTDSLGQHECLVPLSKSLVAVGGSESYVWQLMSSNPSLPASLTFDGMTGTVSGTPTFSDHGRFVLSVRCIDSAQRVANAGVKLTIMQSGASSMKLTELSTSAAHYVEVSCVGPIGAVRFVDLTGWYLRVWTDTNIPLALPFDTFPAGTLMFAQSVLTVSAGGSAGGGFPSFFTGIPFGPGVGSALGVALYDLHGTLVDFASKGTVGVAGLQGPMGEPAGITVLDWSGTLSISAPTASRITSGDTNQASDWSSTVTATPGQYNAGLPASALEFLTGGLPVGRVNALYSRRLSAAGGVPPYSFYLMSTTTPWLSLNSGTGELSGFLPGNSAGSHQVTVRVTDSASNTLDQISTLTVATSSTLAGCLLTVGNAVGSIAGGSSLTLPVQFASSSPLVSELEFTLTLFDTSLQLAGIQPGNSASAAGVSVSAWRPASANSVVVLCRGYGANTAAMASGDIALLSFRVVPASGNTASPGTQAVTISQINARSLQGTSILTDGTAGTTTLSQFSSRDVNRDSIVDVVDVQLTVNVVLSTATPAYPGQGDANGDSVVDVVDIQAIVNCILSTGSCG